MMISGQVARHPSWILLARDLLAPRVHASGEPLRKRPNFYGGSSGLRLPWWSQLLRARSKIWPMQVPSTTRSIIGPTAFTKFGGNHDHKVVGDEGRGRGAGYRIEISRVTRILSYCLRLGNDKKLAMKLTI